ncbi:hypothetical protein SERLADRAFT_397950, partial [Serpula lacrymans var. lacrymans S7.9]
MQGKKDVLCVKTRFTKRSAGPSPWDCPDGKVKSLTRSNETRDSRCLLIRESIFTGIFPFPLIEQGRVSSTPKIGPSRR